MKKLQDYLYYETELGKLYCGDSLEILPLIKQKVDLVLTDPPYNENYNYGNEYNDNRDDYYQFLKNVIIECKKKMELMASLYLKHSSRQIHKILPLLSEQLIFRNLIIWISNSQAHPVDNYDSYYEPIYFLTKTDNYFFNKRAELRKRPPNYWSGEGKEFVGLLVNCWYDIKKDQAGCLVPEIKKINNKKEHPCSMPVKLAERILNISSKKNFIVLEPFLGSGTTAVACEKLNRHWIGIEISENYCAIAKKRIESEASQIKMELII